MNRQNDSAMISDRLLARISWLSGLFSWAAAAYAWSTATNLELYGTYAGVTPVTILGLVCGLVALLCRVRLVGNDLANFRDWAALVFLGSPFFICLSLIDPSEASSFI